MTLASLGLGWVAESTVGDMFATLFSNLPFAIEDGATDDRATVALVVTYLTGFRSCPERGAQSSGAWRAGWRHRCCCSPTSPNLSPTF